MKLVMCEVVAAPNSARFLGGLIDERTFVDLAAAHDKLVSLGQGSGAFPRDMIPFLEAGDEAMSQARAALAYGASLSPAAGKNPTGQDGRRLVWSRDELKLLPAVPRPGKILHTSVNFISHRDEVSAGFRSEEWKSHDWGSFHYKHPTGFLQAPSSVIATEDDVYIPRFTEQLDYEIELAVVIGRRAKYVSKENALDYVAGYCIFNDMSARDIQAREHSNKVILLGKSFDTSCPLGPWLTTRDEIADPQKLRMELRLNGELRQNASTGEMVYGMAELVSWWSNITLEPGDIVTSGSCPGVIAGRKDAAWLAPNDRIEASIEGLGTLVNHIKAEPKL